MSSARRRIATWIAIFAILVAALAPSVSQAVASFQPQSMPWTETCTAVGTKVARESSPLSDSGRHEAAAFHHCPFCLNQASQFVLPSAALSWSPVPGVDADFFLVPATSPSPRSIRAAAQPRAPPVSAVFPTTETTCAG